MKKKIDETIIDGFAIIAYKSWDDLQNDVNDQLNDSNNNSIDSTTVVDDINAKPDDSNTAPEKNKPKHSEQNSQQQHNHNHHRHHNHQNQNHNHNSNTGSIIDSIDAHNHISTTNNSKHHSNQLKGVDGKRVKLKAAAAAAAAAASQSNYPYPQSNHHQQPASQTQLSQGTQHRPQQQPLPAQQTNLPQSHMTHQSQPSILNQQQQQQQTQQLPIPSHTPHQQHHLPQSQNLLSHLPQHNNHHQPTLSQTQIPPPYMGQHQPHPGSQPHHLPASHLQHQYQSSTTAHFQNPHHYTPQPQHPPSLHPLPPLPQSHHPQQQSHAPPLPQAPQPPSSHLISPMNLGSLPNPYASPSICITDTISRQTSIIPPMFDSYHSSTRYGNHSSMMHQMSNYNSLALAPPHHPMYYPTLPTERSFIEFARTYAGPAGYMGYPNLMVPHPVSASMTPSASSSLERWPRSALDHQRAISRYNNFYQSTAMMPSRTPSSYPSAARPPFPAGLFPPQF